MIKGILNWLLDAGGARPSRPETRLTEQEASAIARAALIASQAPFAETIPLIVLEVTRDAGELVWHFSSMTRGSGASVSISDLDGRVVGLMGRLSR